MAPPIIPSILNLFMIDLRVRGKAPFVSTEEAPAEVGRGKLSRGE
jgi:hypothetical protein